MRIISKQKDYYDCAMSTGQDNTLHYIREPKEENVKNIPFQFHWGSGLNTILVGFCGKIYPGIRFFGSEWYGYEPIVCYSFDATMKVVEARRKVDFRRWDRWDERYLKQWFEHYEHYRGNSNYADYFGRSPIFVVERPNYFEYKITRDALLRPFEFFRVFDPYSAYQEIAMWMSNQAIPEKPIAPVSDEIKVQSKGFDKWSFRKEPSKN